MAAELDEPVIARDFLAMNANLHHQGGQADDIVALPLERVHEPLEFVKGSQAAQDVVERLRVRCRQQADEQGAEVARLRHYLTVGLGHRPEAADLVIESVAAEEALGDHFPVLGHAREELEFTERGAQHVT
jgi:hypothetical protein